MFSYYMPTRINFGKGCLDRLNQFSQYYSAKKVLVFTGNESAKISGALEKAKNRLSDYNTVIFEGIQPNPSIKSLEAGIKLCRKEKIDLIVAVGGGSVIDYGKAISTLSKVSGELPDFFYRKSKLNGDKVRLIAVPTTFGTASEITPYAVMTDEQKRTKTILDDERVFPNFAFIDPGFTLTMPKPLVAASCADLLAHALEAYWSVSATELTDCFAVEAIKLFLKYYKQTYQDPGNPEFREKISLASLYAGLAFSNTKTTACHSVSYPMTAIFKIPHGVACALTLGEILAFNFPNNKDKSSGLCKILDSESIEGAKNKINLILDGLNIKRHLQDYGLSRDDIGIIIDKGFIPEKMVNNPRSVTKEDLKEILDRIY